MAIVQTATYEALSAVRRSRLAGQESGAEVATSADAAVAAANHAVLSKLVPSQQTEIDKEYQRPWRQFPTSQRRPPGWRQANRQRTRSFAGARTTERRQPKPIDRAQLPASTCQLRCRQRRNGRIAGHGDGSGGRVPAWTAAAPEQRAVGTRRQRDQGAGWQRQRRRGATQTGIARFWEPRDRPSTMGWYGRSPRNRAESPSRTPGFLRLRSSHG